MEFLHLRIKKIEGNFLINLYSNATPTGLLSLLDLIKTHFFLAIFLLFKGKI